MGSDEPPVAVRAATPDDALGVRRVLDAAVLDVAALDDRLAADEVLVGVDDGRVCGAIVVAPGGPTDRSGSRRDADSTRSALCPERWLDAAHVRAVAVRRRRRGRGIGSALVREAADRFGPLVADFGRELRPFYDPIADEVVATDDGRCWARISAGSDDD